jgi:hypothetical protein
MAGQLAKDAVAADLAARIWRNESASLYPENFHDRQVLPADTAVGGGYWEAAAFLQVNKVNPPLEPGANFDAKSRDRPHELRE